MSDQLTFNLAYGRDETASDFILGASNRAAIDWLQRYPEWGAPGLVVYGASGVGKSHMARLWGQRVAALEMKTLEDIEDFLAADCLQPVIIDDAHMFCKDPKRAEALFHLYQRLHTTDMKMLFIAPMPPQQWDIPLADLASRLRALPQVEIQEPDDQTCEFLLLKYFAERGIAAAPEVLDFLVSRVPRRAPELQKIAVALDQDSLAGMKRLSLAGVRSWVKANLS